MMSANEQDQPVTYSDLADSMIDTTVAQALSYHPRELESNSKHFVFLAQDFEY